MRQDIPLSPQKPQKHFKALVSISGPTGLTANIAKQVKFGDIQCQIYRFKETIPFKRITMYHEITYGLSINRKTAKDRDFPTMQSHTKESNDGKPIKPRNFSKQGCNISEMETDAEINRLMNAHAQANAYEMYCDSQGISKEDQDYSLNRRTFFQNPVESPRKALVSPDSTNVPFSIGTDCSGLEAPIQALHNLKLNFNHKFSCENDKMAVKTILANYKPERMEDDITKRNMDTTPYVDVYIAGFPCQPFSTAGKQQGFNDTKGRGTIFFHVLQYIQSKKPKVFILENVKGLTTMDHGKHMRAILKALKDIKENDEPIYSINHQVLNTKDHGIPHNRPRWYCVGIRKDTYQAKKKNPSDPNRTEDREKGPFVFPETITCPSIELFLDSDTVSKPHTTKVNGKPQYSKTVESNVTDAIRTIKSEGHDPEKEPFVVDCDAGRSKSNYMWNISPCITRSRNNGHWITNRNRKMNKAEMLRLQGINPKTFKVDVSLSSLGQQIGNAMSINVIERI